MRLPPVSVIAAWPEPNYTDPRTHGSALLIVNVVLIALVVTAVAGRFYSRAIVKRWFGLDDSMCALALLFAIGMTTVVILANRNYGWNRHIWDIPVEMIPGAQKIAFAAKLMFTLAATFTRLSLLCFYYRLVQDSGIRWFSWVLHISVAWTLAVCIDFIAETIWLCTPISAYWAWPPSGHCLDEGQIMLGGGVINCVSDLLCTLLPIPIVMRLQMPLRERLGVCVLLCLGFVVTIAGIVRTFYIWKSLMSSWDEPWFAYPLWIAAAVEIDLAVICACAPAWKSMLHQPALRFSEALSSKLSFLRSPNNSESARSGSLAGRAALFNPLRSLSWFQIKGLEFEQTTTTKGSRLSEMEKGDSVQPIELGVDDHQIELPSDIGARSFRHSEVVEDRLAIGPTTPSLMIMKRQSLEQQSTQIGEKKMSATRRSIGTLLPGQWLGESGGKKLLPRR